MGCVCGKVDQDLRNGEKPVKKNSSEQTVVELTENNRVSRKVSIVVDPRLKNQDTTNEAETAIVVERGQTVQEVISIVKSLSSHFIFSTLSSDNLKSLASKFVLYTIPAKNIVFNEGSIGKNFYVISSGSVEVIVNGNSITSIGKGGYFGELALLHNSQRSATIKTLEKSMFWVLSRDIFRETIKLISDEKLTENKSFINKIQIFSSLTPQQKESLLTLLVPHEFSNGQVIMSEGDSGDLLYIIKKGSVICSVGGIQVRKLNAGDFFGEQALLYRKKRSATVIASNNVSCLSLKSEDLVSVLGDKLRNIIYKNSQRIAIGKSEVLNKLSIDQQEKIIENLEVISFNDGDTVITTEYSKNDFIMIVLRGSLTDGKRVVGLFSCLGDFSILKNDKKLYEKPWVAVEDTIIGYIEKSKLDLCIESPLKNEIKKNQILSILKRVQIFRSLPKAKLEDLISKLHIIKYANSEPIIRQGDNGDSFFIIKEGTVEVFKDDQSIRIINRHDFFGERAIINNEKRTASVISKGCVCWVLNKEDFFSVVNKDIRKHIKKRVLLQDDSVLLKDLSIIKTLGGGMFGNVFLAHNYTTKMSYALKTVHRAKIAEFNLSKSILLERRVLMQLDHPFIVKLVKTFKDQQRVYFLMELVQGLDLFEVLRKINRMDDNNSVFYIACLVLILEHLHERNIIYRDLKPENIMVDEYGYLKMIDFGTSMIIKDRTFTIIGTPHYMAPEIVKGTGYSVEADYWSLGIILYEFVCNRVPFGENESDPFKIYNLTMNSQLIFPSFVKKYSCTKLIEKLLNKNPAMRGNIENIKKNSWFLGIDWEELLNKQIRPPYKPEIEDLQKEIEGKLKNKVRFENFIRSTENIEKLVMKAVTSLEDSTWDKEF